MRNEIAIDDYEQVARLVEVLTSQNYVCLVSREENLWIVNYLYAKDADRNWVVFKSVEEYEDELDELARSLKSEI